MNKRFLYISCSLCFLLQNVIAQQTPQAPYPAGIAVSYIRTWDAGAPITDPNSMAAKPIRDVKQATQYVDGLGRPIQAVLKQGSLETGGTPTDMVSTVVYDAFGREQYQYLPSPANNTGGNGSINDGLLKLNPFQQQAAFYNTQLSGQAGETNVGPNSLNWAYSKNNFEASPLNRVNESYAPGASWVGSEGAVNATDRHPVQMKYWINTVIDDVKQWMVTDVSGGLGTISMTGAYPAGVLVKNVTIDEKGQQVIEFKDKEGKVILKKVQLTATADDGTGSAYTGWLCTYYIYDNLNNLRCVIQPEGVKTVLPAGTFTTTILDEQCFRYEYDARNRMIKKKVPGAGEVWMVYDVLDRLVMTQDANLRTLQKWKYTKYDGFNRPEATGLLTDPANYNNHTYHLNAAYGSTAYPVVGSYSNEEMSRTFYDSYSWLSSYGSPLPSTYNSSYDSYFQPASNTNWPYAQANTQTVNLKGLATGSRTKVLNTSTYLYTISFYDEKGRPIQVQSTNISGGTDIATTQYTWAGQPLVSILKDEKQGANVQTTITVTQLTYDDMGRLAKTEKKVSNTLVNSGAMPAYKTIAEHEYDKLGQLKKKKLAPAYRSSGLETLNFDYNIRGWMLGMNRDYLTSTGQSGVTRFGFELGYDKLVSSSGRSFTAAQYNGNITGMIWKSDGDDVKRKYDFSYDAANRLMKGQFEQDDALNSWNYTTMNYTIQMGNGTDPLTAYDANGNIKGMTQYGWKLGAPTTTPIDNLTYNYMPGSNKLLNVIDANNDPVTKLGDFRTSLLHPNYSKTAATVDYTYDANGNLKKDLNKDIGTAAAEDIVYNHLNLPQSISVRKTGGLVKGTITYTYDAAGNKLKKEVAETGQPTKTTLYLGGTVYENDVLQFIGHEEGRIRFKPVAGSIPASLQYDYMLKDHLGNVRMVLTEEQQTDAYPPASMETAQATTEEALYANLPATRTPINNIPGYPTDTYTSPNAWVAKVRAAAGSQKIGPAITLRVMAGDKFNLRVNSWYKTNGTTPGTPVSPLAELVAALTGGIGNISGTHGGSTITEITNSGVLTPGATSFLNNQSYNSTKPKAFVNWILFDEQFKFVGSSSNADQVGGNEEFKTHLFTDLPINKNGYLYVYVSNETPNIDVFFDNLQVTHIRGAILEETHYYPFGLTMSAISSKALTFGGVENKYKFGDKELQSKEFSDGSGLETYDFDARMYDPQIGRMWQIDPWGEKYERQSPFVAFNNSPIYYADPTGKGGIASVAYDKDGNPYIVVTSTIYVYNDNMSEADRKKYAAKIQSDIMSQWNNPQATDEDGNPISGPANELLGTIGSGKGAGVRVEFNVNVVSVAESELEDLMSGAFDASKNFAKLVTEGGSNFDGGYYGQFDVTQLNERGSTTAAHEFGHMLGYYVNDRDNHKGDPQSGQNFLLFDNDGHAWKSDPKEKYYIMSRSGSLSTNEEISKRRVMDVEYSRLNHGGGVRLPTHNSQVEIVDPGKPKQYSSTGTVGK